MKKIRGGNVSKTIIDLITVLYVKKKIKTNNTVDEDVNDANISYGHRR